MRSLQKKVYRVFADGPDMAQNAVENAERKAAREGFRVVDVEGGRPLDGEEFDGQGFEVTLWVADPAIRHLRTSRRLNMTHYTATLQNADGKRDIRFQAENRAEALGLTFVGAFEEAGFKLVALREGDEDLECYPYELGGGLIDMTPMAVDEEEPPFTVEDRPLRTCGCTNEDLEAGRTCGQPACPNRSTLENTCPDCGRVILDAAERARHIEAGEGCLPVREMGWCAGCGVHRPLARRTLDEPNPDGDGPFEVDMCDDCWPKYDGPDGDTFAWGNPTTRRA